MTTLTRQQSQTLDELAIREFGIPSIVLMENAARACADEGMRIVRAHVVSKTLARLGQPGSHDDHPRTMEELEAWKLSLSHSDRPIAVLCGPGNNGGDGFAIARTLTNRGYDVLAFYIGELRALESAGDDVRKNVTLLMASGLEIIELATIEQIRDAEQDISQSVLVVDALFGTGLSRTLDEPYRTVIDIVNQSESSTLSVDAPSGLCCDTGVIMGDCVRADVTVTFSAPKVGFTAGAGETMIGDLKVAEIGIPRHLIEQVARNQESNT